MRTSHDPVEFPHVVALMDAKDTLTDGHFPQLVPPASRGDDEPVQNRPARGPGA